MSTIILLNQSNASRRVVPLPPLVQSNGTSACTNESGATFFFSVGGIYYGSGGSISAISAPLGLYECLFSASKVSVLGQGRVMYSSGTALPASTPIDIVGYDSYDSMRFGQFALPNAAAAASGGLLTFGTGSGQLNPSSGSVGLQAITHSGASVLVIAGDYSSIVTVGIGNIKANTYSGVTVGINNIAANSYSGVTIQGVSNVSSAASMISDITGGVWFKANHSGVSLEILTGGIQPSSIGAGSYSGVTVDGAKFLSAAGERSAASSLLSTNVGNSRLYQEYLWPLRNKVTISGSTMTVFMPDDTTSSWTASVTTSTSALQGIDPAG